MQAVSRRILLVALAAMLGCRGALRDRRQYYDEVEVLELSMEHHADLLEEYISRSCVCVDGEWTDPYCEDAAMAALLIRYQLGWHVNMLLYSSGAAGSPPLGGPPAVPVSTVLCPVDDP